MADPGWAAHVQAEWATDPDATQCQARLNLTGHLADGVIYHCYRPVGHDGVHESTVAAWTTPPVQVLVPNTLPPGW